MKGTTITGRVPIQASKCLRLAVAWGHAVSRRLLIMLALIVMQMFPASAVARVVTVGVYENAPKVFLDESGKPAGIFVEIIEYVAKEEEWELAYVAGTWGEGLDRLARGEIDLMPDVAYAAEREKEFAFHREPVLSDWFQVYTRKDSGIRSIVDLAGKRVAVLERSIQQAAFENLVGDFGLDITLIRLPDYRTIFEKVAGRGADAAITNRFYGMRHVRDFDLDDTAIIFNPTRLFFAASRGGDQELLEAIDLHLVRLKRDPKSMYYQVLNRWTSEKFTFAFPAWIKVVGLVAGTALVVSLVGSLLLKRQINLRTKELALRNEQLQAAYSEMKRAEQSLRESECKHRTLFETANDAIFLMRHDRFIDCNDRTLMMFGCSRDEIIGASPIAYSPPHQPDGRASDEKAREKISLALTQGPQFFEWEHCRQDGTPFAAEVSLNSLDLAGETLLQAIVRDITDRKRAEEALRRSEEQFRLIMENLADLVAVLDLDGCRLYNSPSYGEILGNPDKLRGTSSFDQIHPEDRERVRQAFQETVRTGKGHRLEYRMVDRHGSPRHIESQGSVIRDEHGRVAQVVVVSRDVTERKQAEDAIRELNIGLERRVAERTAELAVARDRAEAADRVKSAFLATMSHELRTPLNSIIGFTGILLQELPGPLNAEQRKQLEIVRKSAHHLLRLINDVLDISKIEAGQLEIHKTPFDLRASIEKVIGIVKPLAEKKGLALRVELSPEIGAFDGDERRVEQVLLNLINNAIKFTDGGEVILSVEPAAPSHSAIFLRVTDTGMGIKPDDLRTLFQPFKQVDSGLTRNHEGTGLGLAICRRLAELMGGEVHAESDWGKGSVFTFTLPTAGGMPP